MKPQNYRKISLISYESSVGRTTVARGLFEYGALHSNEHLQLIGYDIEKPDLLQGFEKVKFKADEIYAEFPRIDTAKCKFCGACVNYCSCGALRLDRYIPGIIIDPEKCEACGDCIEGCNIHGISKRERLTGYVLHGRINGHAITVGKADDAHDFLVPLICSLNQRMIPGSVAICDSGPGVSGFVTTSLYGASLAVIVLKPARGWERNIQFLTVMLKERRIPYALLINKYRNEEGFLAEVEQFCSSEKIILMGIIHHKESGIAGSGDQGANLQDTDIYSGIWENLMGVLQL